jgi:hypothetical protein
MYCPHCGVQNPARSHVCSACGRGLFWQFIGPTLTCPICERPNKQAAQHCHWCGYVFGAPVTTFAPIIERPDTERPRKKQESLTACHICQGIPIVGQCPKCGGYYCSAHRGLLPDDRPCCRDCQRLWPPVLVRVGFFALGWLSCLAFVLIRPWILEIASLRSQ